MLPLLKAELIKKQERKTPKQEYRLVRVEKGVDISNLSS